MTTEETIRAAIGAWTAGDLDAALDLCAEDAGYRIVAVPDLGAFQADCHDRDEFRATLVALLSEFEMLRYDLVEVIASGERAATRVDLRMRHRQTGRMVDTQLAGFWTVRDGKITSLDEWHDTAQVAQARAVAAARA
jgi:ketosteroid isomerase-like protein